MPQFKRSLCLSIFSFVMLLLVGSISANEGVRAKYNFNAQWKLFVGDSIGAEQPDFDDSEWKTVTLPYAWNQEEAYKNSIHDLSTGIAWYRKSFKMPKSAKGKKVFVEFEGVRQGADFYVNGKHVGLHENGIMAVGFDISEHLNYGKKTNIIAVRTDNDWKYKEKSTGSHYQWNNDNFNANYGGIPKNVHLHVTNKVYQTLPLYSNLETTGTYIYASDIDVRQKTITLNAETQIINESDKNQKVQLQVQVRDIDGNVVGKVLGKETAIEVNDTATLKLLAPLSNVEFWSWGYGYLYDVKTTLFINNKPVDEVITRTGFRKTAFKNGMFYLNDRVLQVKGYAQRTSNEWPAIGMSCPPWMSDFSNRMIVEGNGNLVRWMHTTPWKQDVESCDRVGLIQAMPAGDAEKDVTGRRWEHRLEVMRDAIIYNRNNPSIIFYEGGNESISEEHMAELKAIRDRYDPHGGRAIGSREMLDSEVAEYGGEMLYINKSGDIPMWATEYSRDEGLRKYWDAYSYPYHKDGEGGTHGQNVNGSKVKDASVYNRNQDSHAIEDIKRWYDYYEMRPGTGKRVSSGGANIVFSDTNTHFRGAENYRRSGEVDAMRIPKDNFWAHQVMWDGWVDIENIRTHIFGHWNYNDTVTKDIYVVSTADEVELFVNDESKGMGDQSSKFLFTFKSIAFEAGVIKAVAKTANGDVSVDSIITAGTPAGIRLKYQTSPNGLKANGADIAFVDVEVVDENGQRCPLANNLISFELEGEATWLGGIAQGADNYILSKSLPVECGVNRIMIRSTLKSGEIKVTASADNLKGASIALASSSFNNDELSTEYLSKGLPVNLQRGGTPLTPSYKRTRIPVVINKVTAAVNNDDATNSFDDNELTEWRNDGKLATGIITYELEREALLSECVIKLTGWRMRQYPIRILVDGFEVYNDTTNRSLGYVTLPLKPTKGQSVTIELIGANTEDDAFGQIVEITGKKELDLYHDPNAKKSKGQLRIVEVEFYEALKYK